MSGLIDGIPNRYGRSSMSELNPELLVGLRGVRGGVWFVDSGLTASGNGASWSGGVKTLNEAVALAAAGDTVCVAPGHAETCIAASTILISKSLNIIGFGLGRARPTISYTTSTAATFAISGANVRIVNFVFSPLGIDAVVTAVALTGADAEFLGCDFQQGNATNQATNCITTTAAADRMTVRGCRFYGDGTAGPNAAIVIVGGDGHIIQDSIFSGSYGAGVGAIQQLTTTTTNCLVIRNFINNVTASATKAMVFTASSTGMISENRMQILSGAAPITGAAMSWVGANYYAATIGQLGVLI